jgi:hypothetical protein
MYGGLNWAHRPGIVIAAAIFAGPMWQVMPITQFLDSPKFDPETKRVVGVAFEMAGAALQLDDQGNLTNERIAKRIIELAKAGDVASSRTKLSGGAS